MLIFKELSLPREVLYLPTLIPEVRARTSIYNAKKWTSHQLNNTYIHAYMQNKFFLSREGFRVRQ